MCFQLWNLVSLLAGSRWLFIIFALSRSGRCAPLLHAGSHSSPPPPSWARWSSFRRPGCSTPEKLDGVLWMTLLWGGRARKQRQDSFESKSQGAYLVRAISLPIMDLFFNLCINLWQSFSEMYLNQMHIIILLNQRQLAPFTTPVSLSVKEE